MRSAATGPPEQTTQALFWTDHDARQWNDGLLRLAAARRLNLVQTARMLAMAHVAGADAIIACFDAKYHYWSWRPYQAIPQADLDGNPLHARGCLVAAAGRDAEPPRIPGGARLPHQRGRHGAAGVLRHRQRPVLARQPRHGHDTRVPPSP